MVNNLSEQKVHKITGEWDGFGSLKPVHTLDAGRSHTTRLTLDSPRTRPGGRAELRLPPSKHAEWAQAQRANVRIKYEIRGQWFERVGDAPPVRFKAPALQV